MCVGLFSVTAHAETLSDFDINLRFLLYYPDERIYIEINENVENNSKYFYDSSLVTAPMDYAMETYLEATVANSDGSLIAKKGETFTFSISGLYATIHIGNYAYRWTKVPDGMNVGLVHTDGTLTYLYDIDWEYASGNASHSISVTTTADKDVSKIVFTEMIDQYTLTGRHGILDAMLTLGATNGAPTSIEVDIESQEAGLLKDIGEQIGSAINGTPEQNQQAQDAVNGLGDSTDKLGDLGDKMASVEKPSIDSNKISAGSLVPSTSLVVLSSPFQALWENNQLLAMLTIVVTLVLVSWVFFGKKA